MKRISGVLLLAAVGFGAFLQTSLSAWAAAGEQPTRVDVVEEQKAFIYEDELLFYAEICATQNEEEITPAFIEDMCERVLALKCSGASVPDEIYDTFYRNLVAAYDFFMGRKNFVYIPCAVRAVVAIGRDPTDVGGHNLLRPLANIEKITDGSNANIANVLLDLESGNFDPPIDTNTGRQVMREDYIGLLLSCQAEEGGFYDRTGHRPPAEDCVAMTALAIRALAPYRARSDVDRAVEKALSYLSEVQLQNGGFKRTGAETWLTDAAVIEALVALDIELDDTRFVKNGSTVLDAMMAKYIPGEGFDRSSEMYVYDRKSEEWVFRGVYRPSKPKFVDDYAPNATQAFSVLLGARSSVLGQDVPIALPDPENKEPEPEFLTLLKENPLLVLVVSLVCASFLLIFAVRLMLRRNKQSEDRPWEMR